MLFDKSFLFLGALLFIYFSNINNFLFEKNKNSNFRDQDTVNSLIDSIETNGYNLIKALPPNYVEDGSIDYTNFLQPAIDHNNLLIFPSFPILINDRGLLISSKKYIYFPKGSKILLAPSHKGSYNIINILLASSVVLINPVIYGDRYKHLGNEGEWGMGIAIYSSSNVRIYNPVINNCWGDGIYINDYKKGLTSRNVYISNASCSYDRRNGISVISVNSLELINPYIVGSDGTLPMSGIDIEPNYPSDEIKNIHIKNPMTIRNKGYGISIALANLLDSSNFHNIQITISNPVDTGSSIGMYMAFYYKRLSVIKHLIEPENLSGKISIANPTWVRNKVRAYDGYSYRIKNVPVHIINPKVSDKKGAILNEFKSKEAILQCVDKTGNIIIK